MKKLTSLLICILLVASTLLSVSAGGMFGCEVMYKDFKAFIIGEGGAPRVFLNEYCGNAQSVSIPTTIRAKELVAMIPDSAKNSPDYNAFIANELLSDDMLIEVAISEDITSSVKITRYKDYVDQLKVFIDGVNIEFDQEPIIDNGRTLVPLRAIFEALDADVTWDQDTRTAKAVKGDRTVTVQIDNNIMTVDNKEIKLDVPPQIVNSRTLVPVRAVSEAFNCTVYWDAEETNVVIISRAPLTGDVKTDFYYDSINGNLISVSESTADDSSYRYFSYDGQGGCDYKYIKENGVEIE